MLLYLYSSDPFPLATLDEEPKSHEYKENTFRFHPKTIRTFAYSLATLWPYHIFSAQKCTSLGVSNSKGQIFISLPPKIQVFIEELSYQSWQLREFSQVNLTLLPSTNFSQLSIEPRNLWVLSHWWSRLLFDDLPSAWSLSLPLCHQNSWI